MRRVILNLVAALLTTLCLPAVAQQSINGGSRFAGTQDKVTLEGIWQLCKFQKSDSGRYECHVLPVIKIITKDGAYHDLLIRTAGGISGIVEQGTYKKENDTTIVVIPELIPGSPQQDVVEKKMTFHLQGPQWMVIERQVTDNGEESHEIWMRLRVIHDGQSLIQELLNADMNSPEGQYQRPHSGNGPKKNFEGQGQRQNGKKKMQSNSNNSQNQETSPIDNSWMNDN
jgi:hypothetical protein